MACSTCDGYQLIDADNDGVIDSPCPDCNVNVIRCRLHGCRLVDGRCRKCLTAARVAEDSILRCRRPAALHPLIEAAAA